MRLVFETDSHRLFYFGHGLVGGYLLVDQDRAVLVDTGLPGELPDILKGLTGLELEAILLTHGHIDHAGNAFTIRQRHPVPVYAHPADQAHIDQVYPYRGWTRLCGWLEGSAAWRHDYRPVTIDHPLEDGQHLPFWGGLEVVHLPGHTVGHCGFYSRSHRLLLAGDLFACYFGGAWRPPFYFNSRPNLLRATYRRVASLPLDHVFPCHWLGTRRERLVPALRARLEQWS
ncbi:MAG: MBL fold metallo-hydrolase [Candidatus Eremiobacteraeota bacterium]|nr:MBL fold metallo-hydrolase [Candidatus Eremiobacteraeota bacterium]